MDEINSSFGSLSMSAAEWKPSSAYNNNNSNNNNSDLNPEAVKEFIPGRGWSSSAAAAAAGELNVVSGEETDVTPEKDYDETQTPVTVPAGPSPPPTPISFRALHSLGLSDDLYRYHRDLSLESTRQMDPADPQHKAVPLPYCNAFLLDDAAQQKRRGRSSFGYPSATFQVTNREDGHLYCLKRFDNVRSVSPKIALAVSDRWSTARAVQEHPGVVPFYQCFVAQRAVFFVHQYIPGSRTLSERLLGPQQFGGAGHPLPETVLWSCIAQLISVIRTIHGSNLAVRTIRLQHILSNQCIFDSDGGGNAATGSGSSGRLRLRLGSLGVVDTLEFEARKHVADLQMEDMRDLGRLILSLATATDVCAASTATDVCAETMNRCEQYLARNYSPELQSLTMTLIRRGPRPPSILEVSRAIASRICFEEQDAVYRALDRTERALSSEYESGRALRLLLKLGFVNERPELGPNRRWAQSGDCYMLTLFRDYVFHQADGAGYPVMDLGHVVTALNKLDAADEEKIVLASRDGKSLMVVSYADVSRCLESAFHELCSAAVAPSALQY